jgi:hypothetical protein
MIDISSSYTYEDDEASYNCFKWSGEGFMGGDGGAI